MSYSFVAPLTTYTEQQRLPLITKAVFAARSAALFTKQVGIKRNPLRAPVPRNVPSFISLTIFITLMVDV